VRTIRFTISLRLVSPEDVDKSVQDLNSILDLAQLSIHSEFLALLPKARPEGLKQLELTKVSLAFLYGVVREYYASRRQHVFMPLTVALLRCDPLTVVTYKVPCDETLKTMKMVTSGMVKMDVDVEVWR
jgi:hypothetical protein